MTYHESVTPSLIFSVLCCVVNFCFLIPFTRVSNCFPICRYPNTPRRCCFGDTYKWQENTWGFIVLRFMQEEVCACFSHFFSRINTSPANMAWHGYIIWAHMNSGVRSGWQEFLFSTYYVWFDKIYYETAIWPHCLRAVPWHLWSNLRQRSDGWFVAILYDLNYNIACYNFHVPLPSYNC